MTSIVKSAELSSFSSRPTLMAMRAISARVFISAAMHPASRTDWPVSRAPKKQPPSFPTTAAANTSPHASRASGVPSEPDFGVQAGVGEKIGNERDQHHTGKPVSPRLDQARFLMQARPKQKRAEDDKNPQLVCDDAATEQADEQHREKRIWHRAIARVREPIYAIISTQRRPDDPLQQKKNAAISMICNRKARHSNPLVASTVATPSMSQPITSSMAAAL